MKIKLASAIVAGLLGAFGFAAPASASLAECPNGNICLYDAVSYGTLVGHWTPGYILTLSGDCLVLPASSNNKASSLYVNAGLASGTSLTFWDLPGGGANRGVSTSGYQDANLLTSPGISSFSNVISAICVNT